ncbi:ATP-dependent DNA ligase [Tessaracoccus antarcticus]|uniref:DNA ligase (ATP) n=1 Tax=Tessaracoccus antarcticus TaxID=2479848 RepID=A0A3M0G5K5_9ACTN|nr:ATP-dependent DNA ligase [Tessaracoccus antarcticus]
MEVDGHRVKVTNLDKVLYPSTRTTKGEVIAYYHHVAPWMLPYVTGRPATRKRWPNGVGDGPEPSGAFFHKGLDPRSTPDWVHTAVLEHDDGPKTYPLIDDAATLVWLAQLASLEMHVPQWRFTADGTPANPDRLVLDLDPGPGATMDQCVELAHLIREVLDGIGMASVPVTSGSKGIHLYAPLDGTLTSDAASELARQLARSLEGMRPDLVVSDMKKAVREGKVLLDWSQNNGSKTTIAPYSLRGRSHPTVAAPRMWDEIVQGLQQLEFTDVLQRLQDHGDPMAGVLGGDDRLITYRSMRDANVTPEPVPEARPRGGGGHQFVIQEHHARRLHHDFRLERDGVLVSWALPKGPPTDPGKNHLAVQTEDHPMEYATFAGDIPKGQYGGGHVDIWDSGTYVEHKWRDGKEVIATLQGQPDGGLGGEPHKFALIHTALGGDKKNWLIHLMDPDPDPGHPAEERPKADTPEGAAPGVDAPDVNVPVAPSIAPMMATAGRPEDVGTGEWHFEIKWDGYRAIAVVQKGALRLTSRGGLDLTSAYPELSELVDTLAGHDAVIDGEVVVLDEQGRSSFELLQNHGRQGGAHYMAFDVLWLDGTSLLDVPWVHRRALLEQLITPEHPHIHVPPALGTNRDAAIAMSQDLGLEGVVAKRAQSRYEAGRRSSSWVKLKNVRTQEVVVIGWSSGNSARSATLGSVLLAVHEDGELRYVGKAGSGFSDEALARARAVLEGIETDCPPVDDVPKVDARGARWVEPLLVGEVTFAEWTASGRLRQPVWRGWRPDRMAEDVVREQ